MNNVLVTGGAGMIGSNLVKRLINIGNTVKVADNLWRGKLENLIENGKEIIDLKTDFHNVDLRDYKNCVDACEGIDTVYHLADVVAGINYVFENEISLFRSNILINTNMLHAAIERNVSNFIYVGTACSYPKSKQSFLNPPPFTEEDVYPAEPESAYGWSKLMGEYECDLARREGLIKIGILRLHNVYGYPSELDPSVSQVIPALCRKAIEFPKNDFIVWGSGEQRRTFVFIDDVIDALQRVTEKGMNKGAIQIGREKSVSIKEIAEKIVEISGKNIDIQFDTTKPEGDKDRTADWTKAKEILDWRPCIGIDEGLFRTYRWCESKLLNR